ncbi:large ribosomal RNA subunit accumulation protein YCED homolog 1, chloroplastic [Rhodamnia argentea]|uniref:Large ribosomal RNA subunit accumulation protein YCED homolog 1, chloroplastic n=1 Tax=Rhodamnia argentea TaxID=178133 RepID=A0A8B8QND6_9MYRT|nr:large ribosomal RNA subunit accumulation protein YCED homolog 1, chloroplastic [Rhodamnia argentea]
MSPLTSSLVTVPFCSGMYKLYSLKAHKSTSSVVRVPASCQASCGVTGHMHRVFMRQPSDSLKRAPRDCGSQSFTGDDTSFFDWGDLELDGDEDVDSPWEGAVVYKRNSSVSHVEYCTTLERLGLEKLSTELSKSRASAMGIRVTKAVKDYPHGTPVQISIDVSRKKQKLRLDGILRTVITLGCNRCGEPAAECIYSNFSLLLTEDPIEEPELIDMGVIFGRDKSKPSPADEEGDDEDEGSIDLDDRLYFPPEEKEIDISKHLRDLVHVEITINAVCDPNCKGMCLKCGTNLNTSSCACREDPVEKKVQGPLGNLRKQMQRN